MSKAYLDLIEKVILDQVYESQPTPEDITPLRAYSMVSEKRLRTTRACCEEAVTRSILGAFVECGVWRGGSIMMMAAVHKEYNADDFKREIYVCDSFEGLPRPSLPQDHGLNLFVFKELQVSENEVRKGFELLGLLDDNIHFVKGWFKDTLPKLKETIGPIAVLRSDGDLYESTRNVLDNLYPLLQPGGYYIEDDYYNIYAVRQAIDDYRAEHGITHAIQRIDNSGCFWRIPK